MSIYEKDLKKINIRKRMKEMKLIMIYLVILIILLEDFLGIMISLI
jgi:hypothetical protein